jgi:probable HAF family extracellular repeat protein
LRKERNMSRRSCYLKMLVVGILLLTGQPALAGIPPGYTIKDLGTLGGSYSRAYDINDKGQVVGWSYTADGKRHAFRTAPNAPMVWPMDDLGSLGGTESEAWGINELGQVVGWSYNNGGYSRAFRTSANLPINPATDNLGTFGGTESAAYDINESGQVVGWAYNPQNGYDKWRAFRTAANMPINPLTDDLGTLGGPDAVAKGISDNGSVVGWARTTTDAYHAFLYTQGPMTDLGTLGGWFSIGQAINASGQIAGVSYMVPGPTGPTRAFLYHGGELRDLGTVGEWWSSAEDINDEGLVVGDLGNNVGNPVGAFVWGDLDGDGEGDPGEMVDLNTLIPQGLGLNLWYAEAINNAGQIVGTGVTPLGEFRAYLLSPVPEPMTVGLLALGAVVMLRRRRGLGR